MGSRGKPVLIADDSVDAVLIVAVSDHGMRKRARKLTADKSPTIHMTRCSRVRKLPISKAWDLMSGDQCLCGFKELDFEKVF